MADEEKVKDIKLLKRTQISVYVDEALPDILVVTYEYGVQIFKGVLLDSTKRNLPCGVNTMNPAFKASKINPDDDTLFSVNQRFAYTDPTSNSTKKKNIQISSKYKNNKMTVRLRPRQVLCSKCKGICNENSENISTKRKAPETTPPVPPKRGLNAPVTRSVYNSEMNSTKKKLRSHEAPTLVPKLHRLTPEEESLALSGKSISSDNSNSKNKYNNVLTAVVSNIESVEDTIIIKEHSNIIDLHYSDDREDSSHSDADSNEPSTTAKKYSINPRGKSTRKMLLKKKRDSVVGSMENLWDEKVVDEETIFEDNSSPQHNQQQENNNSSIPPPLSVVNTRTIKISYGPQGEGTVLKIPAQIENLSNMSDDSEENVNIELEGTTSTIKETVQTKAARRAIKKAKKEARRKCLLSGNSPVYLGGSNGSPRYNNMIGSSSPRYTIGSASPRHGLGNNSSPRYMCNSNSYELNAPRRRKHKMKHKKKHREDRKHNKESEVSSSSASNNNLSIISQSSPLQQLLLHNEDACVKTGTAIALSLQQKLSINLKRLNNTYTTSTTTAMTCDVDPLEINKNLDSDPLSSSDEQYNDQVPDFPPPNTPLMFRINSQTVSSALCADGERLLVGDVVWGKIHGFPWWPGKVLTITSCGGTGPQAHVAWYGSSTSSLMQCDQLNPYLDNFKIRYNKKKRGPYKEAIKQATSEARENAENRLRQPLGNSPSHNNIITQVVVPPALASPREIDVVS